jgi:hypothetical protein
LAKFLNKKYTQPQFITKLKQENGVRMDDKGSDFNYTDPGYVQVLSHEVRLNKRPITGKPAEQFGSFTQGLLSIDNTNSQRAETPRSNQNANTL